MTIYTAGFSPEDLEYYEITRVHMFPVHKGMHEYPITPNSTLKVKYYAMWDGWCVAWHEVARLFRSDNDYTNQHNDVHRMFLTKHDAEALAARLLLGLPPDEDEYSWIQEVLACKAK